MAERPHREGWRVPQRAPAIAAVALLALVALLLALAGWFYERQLASRRYQPIATFPAPGVEDYVHAGVEDPEQASARPTPDPAIEAAKRAVVAQGLPGWPRR